MSKNLVLSILLITVVGLGASFLVLEYSLIDDTEEKGNFEEIMEEKIQESSRQIFSTDSQPSAYSPSNNIERVFPNSSDRGRIYGTDWIAKGKKYRIGIMFKKDNGQVSEDVREIQFEVTGEENISRDTSRREAIKRLISETTDLESSEFECQTSNIVQVTEFESCEASYQLESDSRVVAGATLLNSYPSDFRLAGCVKPGNSKTYETDKCLR